VSVVEVGPRDGLQNEKAVVPTAAKVAFVDRLTAAGHSRIEVSAFVSPKWVPQMGDAGEVFAGITRKPGVRYSAHVPNRAGLDRALAAGVREVAIFAAASETFSRRNINQSIEESLATYQTVAAAAIDSGATVRAYLYQLRLPFQRRVDPARVVTWTERLLSLGAYGLRERHHRHPRIRAGQAYSISCSAACRSSPGAALPRRARRGADNVFATLEPVWRRSMRRGRRTRRLSLHRVRRATSQPRTCSSCCRLGILPASIRKQCASLALEDAIGVTSLALRAGGAPIGLLRAHRTALSTIRSSSSN
jgi:hypothetical protein